MGLSHGWGPMVKIRVTRGVVMLGQALLVMVLLAALFSLPLLVELK